MKKARILNSEAFQREQVNQATGEAEALVWKAKAQATSVEVLADAMSQQVTQQIRSQHFLCELIYMNQKVSGAEIKIANWC